MGKLTGSKSVRNRQWLKRIVILAAACAGLKCQELGGRAAIPELNEVIDYINSKEAFNSIIENM